MEFFFNSEFIIFIRAHSNEVLDQVMLFITEFGPYLMMSLLLIYSLIKKKFAAALMLVTAIALSLETVYIIKKVLQIPRPPVKETYDVAMLTYSNGYSFPSLHSAFSLSIVPFLKEIFKSKILRGLLIIVLLSIALSRIYLAVHYVGDVIVGGLLGYVIALVVISLNKKYDLYHKFIYHFSTKLEFRRQSAHLFTGLAIILLLKLQWLNAYSLLAILIIGGSISLLSRYHRIPLIYPVLEFFERPEEIKRFPGKGSFFLVLGSFFSVLFFKEQIALAAIAIMAIGDSITAVIGIYFGRWKNPFNTNKHLDSTLFAIFFATIGAYTFVDFHQAFLASTVAMIFEALTREKINRVIDDNLVIPLVAGFVMTALIVPGT